MNLYSLAKKFPNEDAALLHLIRVRWPQGVRCVECDHGKCWLVDSKNKTGKPRRLFQCAKCKLQFSATAGTLFHDSHLPLTKWFAAIALMVDAKKGIAAAQLMRHVGMSYKTAWYVCHRIREAMSESDGIKLGDESTPVEIDETYVGGVKRRVTSKHAVESKTLVIGMAERKGRIHLEIVPNRSVKALKPVIDAKINPDTKRIITDGLSTYQFIFPEDKHEPGNHKEEFRDKNWSTTQTVENAFSLFKRGIIGQYHWLSPWHMNRYMREFCWRYNRRHMQPWIFEFALTNMVKSKPLPYKELTKF